ncbi:MFS transporter [Microbacterium sp. WCS2018Hpa-9]|uniref:MFS transporter n=1 Tax=Microbacterium sp. WCS2018Hpa-9 TaxID=3073635 RepID=UPI00288BEC3A|nr:MFS transporter [Microbacterium sp. WCS2018Hpa-9]
MQGRSTSRERTSVIGAFIGNSLEWFDFFVFGTASALVFGRVFFPEIDAGAALLASFATLWVGFLTRPLGALIFGHFGDRVGRKNVLLVTLLLMGTATALIGVLPGYAQIGILAPILLVVLRAAQGLAVGGEWGGAVLIATENAAPDRKTIAAAWVQQGSPVGSLLATGSFALVGMLPDEQFFEWGWRIPFLASTILVVVGIVLRLRLQESEEFVTAKAEGNVEKAPALAVLRRAPLVLVLGIAASVIAIAMAYFTNTFLLAWATGPLGIERQVILNVLVGATVVQFIAQWLAGHAAQRFGRLRVILIGLGLSLVFAVPFFAAIDSANVVLIAVMLYVSFAGVTIYFAVYASFLAYAFPPELRYSGVSLAYQLCSSVIGGSTPLVAQWILNASGNNPWAVMAYYVALLLATTGGVIGLYRVGYRRQASLVAEAAHEGVSGK